MGQKVHPYGFRLGYNKTWRSRWFAKQGYADLLHEDLKLKEVLRQRLKAAGISSVEVDRPGNKLRITIRTSRPGIIIGRKGAEIEKLKQELHQRTNREVFIDIQEVHKPELDAQLVSESVALQLEKRVAFRRAMRKAVDSALRFGCQGIKIRVAGRLNGAEIARSEWYLQGRLPLHTLRADIDYGASEARTTYGVIGVKTWIYRGEIIETKGRKAALGSLEPEPLPARRREPRPEAAQGRPPAKDRERARQIGPTPMPVPAASAAAPAAAEPAVEEAGTRGPGPVTPPLAPKPEAAAPSGGGGEEANKKESSHVDAQES